MLIPDVLAKLMFTEAPGGNEDDTKLDDQEDSDEDEATVPISELRKVRSEAAGWRKQFRELESKVADMEKAQAKAKKDAELAELEEVEKYKKIAADSQAELEKANSLISASRAEMERMKKERAIFSEAAEIGFRYPGDAARFLDLQEIEIVDGKIDNEKLKEQINELAKSRPDLLAEQKTNEFGGGATNPGGQNLPGPKLMSKDSIERMKQQSQAAMRNGDVAAAVSLYNRAWEKQQGK